MVVAAKYSWVAPLGLSTFTCWRPMSLAGSDRADALGRRGRKQCWVAPPAFGTVVGRVGAAVRKVTHYSFPTIVTLTLSFEIYVGQDKAENTLRLRLFHSPCLRIAPHTPWLPVWMEQRTADLNLTGANGWLEEG